MSVPGISRPSNRAPDPDDWKPADPPRHPVLFVNPSSGGGAAGRAGVVEGARDRGIEVVVLEPGQSLGTAVELAVDRGADALGMAGGDGALAATLAFRQASATLRLRPRPAMSAAPSVPESSATAEAALAGLLYERYSSRILGYCRSRLRSREEAEDAVQHTFLNAYRSLRGGVVPQAEAAWLFKIAANVCHERRRSAWRRSRIEAISDDGELRDAVAPPTSAHDELAGLADALAQLTPNQRRAILLREWQGLSYREIAAELETTEAAVESLLFRARRSLAR